MKTRIDISQRQLAAIPHILAARNIEEGASLAGVSRATVFRWLRDPAFVRELRTRREQIVNAAMETLKASLQRAVSRMAELIEDDNPRVALHASKALIEFTLRRQEIEDVSRRMDAIEVNVERNPDYT